VADLLTLENVRFWGIIIAVVLRVVLLFVMISLIDALGEPFYIFAWDGVLEGAVNFATVIFVLGGAFLMYTAVKEIRHLLSMEHLDHDVNGKSGKSAVQVVVLIVMMNLIFSFDSVLSALAITDVFPILATAILLSGAAMLLLADGVTKFLEKNRMYEVLGLFMTTPWRSKSSGKRSCQCRKRHSTSLWSCCSRWKSCNLAMRAN